MLLFRGDVCKWSITIRNFLDDTEHPPWSPDRVIRRCMQVLTTEQLPLRHVWTRRQRLREALPL